MRFRRSLPYQLGCLLPDWFYRHPIHRTDESMDDFLMRAVRIRHMPDSPRRDWELGLLAHFICDYCTQAHNEEYYRFYRHRVYEVAAQKRIKAFRVKRDAVHRQIRELRAAGTADPEQIKDLRGQIPGPLRPFRPLPVPETLLDPETDDVRFREELHDFLTGQLEQQHREIRALGCEKWYTDERVMDLDILWARKILYAVLSIFGENVKR